MGQLSPQQGASIAATACPTTQLKPACSAKTSAKTAIIPFLTKSKLVLTRIRHNFRLIHKTWSSPEIFPLSCDGLQISAMKAASRMSRCSNHQQNELQCACIYSFFSVLTSGIRIVFLETMKPTLIILGFVSLAGLAIAFPRIVPARASAHPAAEPVNTKSCVDRC
jgi:hypothetical protein